MRSPSRIRVPSGRVLGLALLHALSAQACTKEQVTGVTIGEIDVLPPSVTVLRDESVQLVAEVRDEQGDLLETAQVTWTSDRPSVVYVSADGLVSAVGVGPAMITASLNGVAGSASITVMSPTLLRAEPESLTLRGAIGAQPPGPVHVEIRDEGKPVSSLEVALSYPAGSDAGWLEARLRDDRSPTTLEVGAQTSGRPAGVYEASVLVWGAEERDSPVVIPVEMTLAGLGVRESDGRTFVAGSSAADELTVELLLAPERDVVLRVRSEDTQVAVVSPEELRFTDEDWNVPQTLRVTAGGGGGGWFGYDATEITITVETGVSDAAYGPVPAATVPVTVFRSPFGAGLEASRSSTDAAVSTAPTSR